MSEHDKATERKLKKKGWRCDMMCKEIITKPKKKSSDRESGINEYKWDYSREDYDYHSEV